MAKKNSYIIFLNNRYRKTDNAFYLKQLRDKVSVAAEGGVRFFLKNKIKPDILIGDFDSAPRLSKKYKERIEIIKYPVRKNKTDSQLAVELAIDRGAREIIICGAFSTDEIDHTLSNILLLKLIKDLSVKKRRKIYASIISPGTTMMLLGNETVEITGKKGDYFSVIPLKKNSRIKYSGMSYPAPSGKLKVGDTLSLRNRLLKRKYRVTAEGLLLVIISSGLSHSQD